ncbi:uncharacterized protein EI90DRAFT_3092703 [Cantharellus anzutake]|uniref:uncharacterized protein n=1 Tax=Cantharellus anzutake TaxID=1750568 RepID=UPI001903C06A|nr:uncharacterized protein EI90DRAFT_3092703 [Cantharellus anzutake]KAF8312901.1 hypothetical protein EI90DRAFT_3092703 [Cantharellus anzutake]
MNGTMLTLGSWQKLSEARRESRRRYATRQDDQAPDPADTTSRDDAPDQMDESSAPSAGEDGEAFEKAKPLPNTVSQPMITPPKGREIQSVLPSGVQESQAAVPEKPSTRRKSKKKAEKEDLMEILSSLLEDAEEVPHAGEQQSTGSENAKTPGKRKRGDEERTAIMATVHRQKRRKPRKRNGMDS